ncbi:nuclear transport factor 2 family protein [Amycolatopsis sp. NPDC049252]|uniref:nuclear transport factor 2 family protein n=1 Tax=Amycolatopsis sp. NPDC049252 TaxID=3363933 RepID=UPI00372090F5
MDRTDLPGVVAAHIAAVNAFDLDGIAATFHDDAVVNDVHREFAGTASIREWIAHEIVGDRVTMDVIDVRHHHGQVIVSARYDGEYDKTNLPAELVLTNYFSVEDGKITTLIVVRNTPAPY